MWEGLDAVGWAALKHNYGSAENVPALLRRCAGPDQGDVDDAAFELLNHLFHQGGWICSAAPAALPFLVRLAASPDALFSCRRVLLELVSRLAAEAGQVTERFLDPGWQRAWEHILSDVLDLLADPAPEIRRDAAHVLGGCDSAGELVLPALVQCWRAETDPATCLDLVLALGQAARREPVGPQAAGVLKLLHGLLDAPQTQIRLAATHALAPADPNLPVQRIDLLLEAVRDPSVELWRHTRTVEAGANGVHRWTAALFAGPSTAFALGLLKDHPDVDQRIGALTQASGLLAQWRSAGPALLPALCERLDDPSPEVRFRAAELLACLGPAAAGHADEAAVLLGDTASRATRKGETVAEAALWALARMNDARCVPALIEVMTGTRSGFASGSAGYPATAGRHYAVLPGLHEVLGQLLDHAEPLMPVIGAQLEAATDGHVLNRLCQLLAGWGPAAKSAVPPLLGLMEDERAWAAAARALAGIGEEANRAQDLLLARSSTGGAHAELAAWAYWKVGGEPGPAVEALGAVATETSIPLPVLRMLADLGPHAACYVKQLRQLTADNAPWTRIEAAHALWAITGDTDTTVPVFIAALQGLAKGSYLPVMLPAMRYLAQTGHAGHPAVPLSLSALSRDERLRSSGGWRGFVQDESIRSAIKELLAGCGGSAAATI
ncbi:HEAT repeat domain-containing protein [Streptomyces uncialis]|uniref:HEAT repeat domain-containing protein n=1 Tax=Streptomyces uncialis TaxID=1048205 RepID=UPI0037AC8079